MVQWILFSHSEMEELKKWLFETNGLFSKDFKSAQRYTV